MVGLSEALRFSYGWILRGSLIFVWLDSLRPPVFVWLDFSRFPVRLYSYNPPGFPMVGLLETPGFRIVGHL